MTRRIGQAGNVFQRGFTKSWNPAATAYGRYWIDVPGEPERKRRTVVLGVCTSRTIARCKLRAHIELEGINSKATFATSTAPAMTFRVQAGRWLASLSTRRRKPLKPATIANWRHSLNKWVLPTLGERLLADTSNGAMRELVEKMAAAGLSPKSIVNHSLVVKLVLASAVSADGDQLYPRKWNHDFIGLPIVKKEEQHRPSLTQTELGEILSSVKERYAVFFALLAGTGLRVGEGLALKPGDLSPDCRVLYVRRSIWAGKEQTPKTPNAIREVDIPEPLAALLRSYVENKTGYLFATATGGLLVQRNVLHVLHTTGKKVGFHAFRRFRTETLRRALVPGDLERLWLGHAQRTVTDLYAGGLQLDKAWRREWCDRAGLGFELGYAGLQKVVPIDSAKAA
ncbi:MAG: site-specific integrase [Candidatus Sulfotelmatobacter sp.]